MAPVVFILALLMPPTLASRVPGCFSATLPNILGLGTCLGTALDLCTDTVDEILSVVVRLVVCLVDAMLALNVPGVLAALLQIIQIVLSALGLNLGILSTLIKPLCAVSNVRGCETILSERTTCLEPIAVVLPEGLNLEQCLTTTLLLCKRGTVATDKLLVNLIEAIACLLNRLAGSDPTVLISGLACTVVELLESVAGRSNFLIRALVQAIASSIGSTVQCF